MRFLARIPWLLLLLLLNAVAWSIRPISDMDVLWHLRTGQWMLAHGEVIRHDVFSATRHGCEWVSVPWLYEVMLARLHAVLGWTGLTLWQVSMVAAITLQTSFLVWLLRRQDQYGAATRRWDWKWPFLSVPAALAVLLLLRLLQLRINCRPELFTYLFMGSFLILLTLASRHSEFRIQNSETNQEPRTKNQKRRPYLLWLLPILQVLWTNTHGAFILGPALVWAYAAAAWLGWFATRWEAARERPVDPDGLAPLTEGEWPRQPSDPAPTRLTVAAVLTTLACLATPYSFAGAFYPFHLFTVLTDPLYKNGIGEAHAVNLFTALDSGGLGYPLLACWVLAGLGLLGQLMEGLRDGKKEQLSVSSEQLADTSEQASASGLRRTNSRLFTVRRLLLTAYCALFTSCRALWQVLLHNPNLGYFFSCAAMAYLSLAAIRNVPLLPLAVAPLVAGGIEYAADGFAAVVARVFFAGENRSWFLVHASWLRKQGSGFTGRRSGPGCSNEESRTKNQERAAAASRGVDLLHGRAAHILAQALLALALLFTYRAIVSERFYASLGWRMRFAIGCSDHEHPLAACDFIERYRAEISCRTLYGDTRSADLFLARFGPQWPVYFDGRHAEIYDPPIFRTAARTRSEPAIFVREAAAYGIGLVCFSLTDLKEDRSPLAVALGKTNTWRLVYLDDCAALFAAVTPSNAAFVARYGLSCAPTNAALQRALFADWLQRQGRANLAALHDPANRSLEEGILVGSVVNALQLGGLWAPTRDLTPLRFCRVAAFMDHIGWNVVADDIYQQALRWPDSFPATLPRTIRHAQAACRAISDPVLQEELRSRIRTRAEELQRIDPKNPLVAAALKEIATNAPVFQR